MSEKQKILLKGISQLWGEGGQRYLDELQKEGFHYMPLDDKTLSAKEYFQYNSVYSDVYPEKFVIHDLNKNVLKCVKCGDTSQILEPCNNCGSNTDLHLDWRATAGGALHCVKCKRDHQQTRWICSKCNCDNSILNTLSHWVELEKLPNPKSGCFIATACYGDYNAEDVFVLREFRDNVLLKSKAGQSFVKFYYNVSPPIAKSIENSSLLKSIIKYGLLTPIIRIIKKN